MNNNGAAALEINEAAEKKKVEYYGYHACKSIGVALTHGPSVQEMEELLQKGNLSTDLNSIVKRGLLSARFQNIEIYDFDYQNKLPKKFKRYNNIFLNYFVDAVPPVGGLGFVVRIDGKSKIYNVIYRNLSAARDEEIAQQAAKDYGEKTLTVEDYANKIKQADVTPFGGELSFTYPYFFEYSISCKDGQGEILIKNSLPLNFFEAILYPVATHTFNPEDFGMEQKMAEDVQEKMSEDLAQLGWEKGSVPVVPNFKDSLLPANQVYGSCFFDFKKYVANKIEVHQYLEKVPYNGYLVNDFGKRVEQLKEFTKSYVGRRRIYQAAPVSKKQVSKQVKAFMKVKPPVLKTVER